ncbi:MAG: alginate export family protein [Gammaproteobacteria bacterium]|nr:alginate export family protein [Gammaproteobacteria bacterium]MBU2059359.1 alginate export family protein [Gammaproteobacteria bacterium]MBU2175261.1 alginate export family protein [Gammaproteobacteria bacterium]MBU2247469.1 alginate export family protein [Gammaproteobacteria bacterium]MBU2346264.1 alginate export family protein [Gammaproteobacteria bacterium]
MRYYSLIAMALAATCTSVFAVAEEKTSVALAAPELKMLFRYRLEAVDQNGLAENALASTLLSRFSLTQKFSHSWSAGGEFDYVAALGDKNYNDSINGKTAYPVVADPAGADLNQVFIQYQGDSQTLKIGRQRINLANERFVGGVGWRQNEQTFDAVRYQASLSSDLKLDYSYSSKVNRVFGSKSPQGDWSSDVHLLDLRYQPGNNHQLGAFVYQMEFDDAPLVSNQTLGLDYQYSQVLSQSSRYQLYGSYAWQQEAGDNPNAYNAEYWTLEANFWSGAWQSGVGIEVLGADTGSGNGIGFATPLATLHKFQGFADKFLATPVSGIEDKYIKLGYKLDQLELITFYHWLDAAEGEADYGKELNVQLSYSLNAQHAVLLKYADYQANSLHTDTSKFWLQWLAKY